MVINKFRYPCILYGWLGISRLPLLTIRGTLHRASEGTDEWSWTRSPSGQLPWGGQLVSEQSLPASRSVAEGSG